jgi:hypothetical protein
MSGFITRVQSDLLRADFAEAIADHFKGVISRDADRIAEFVVEHIHEKRETLVSIYARPSAALAAHEIAMLRNAAERTCDPFLDNAMLKSILTKLDGGAR